MRNTLLVLTAALFLSLGTVTVEKHGIQGSIPEEGAPRVVINEVCTDNLSCLKDSRGKHPDWVELYNPSSSPVDLTGYHLSDSASRKAKWAFPEVVLSPGAYALVYASGAETAKAPLDEDAPFSLKNFIFTGRGIEEEPSGMHASFRLPSRGCELYLSDGSGRLVDYLQVPSLEYDTTYAASEDGGGNFIRMTPTPASSNTAAAAVAYPVLDSPVFSAESGFYDTGFSLEITGGGDDGTGTRIRYTLDGSVPDDNSPLYEGALEIADRSGEENIYSGKGGISVNLHSYNNRRGYALPEEPVDKCTVVRAAAFGKNGERSKTSTAVYFIGYGEREEYDNTRVVSIVCDPEDLFGYDRGIYMIGRNGEEAYLEKLMADPGAAAYLKEHPEVPLDGSVSVNGIRMDEYTGCNYTFRGVEWERPCFMSFFDEDHEIFMEQNAGVRIKGNKSRNFPQKSFNLISRKEYSGSDTFSASPIPSREEINAFSLSAGGNDEFTKLKDDLGSCLARDLAFTTMRYEGPCYVFLNGEFWGACSISEKQDARYISDYYKVAEENVVIVKNSMLEEGGAVFLPDLPELFIDVFTQEGLEIAPSSRYYSPDWRSELGEKIAERDFARNDLYGQLLSFLNHSDLRDDHDYERFCGLVDMESLMDYFSYRIFIDPAADWPNTNIGMWRARQRGEQGGSEGRADRTDIAKRTGRAEGTGSAGKDGSTGGENDCDYGDGKWRMLNYDTNLCFDYSSVSTNTIDKALNGTATYKGDRMFGALMENEGFRREFYAHFLQVAEERFDPDRTVPILRSLAGEYEKPVTTGYSRWFSEDYGYGREDYERRISEMEAFLRERADNIIPCVRKACSGE